MIAASAREVRLRLARLRLHYHHEIKTVLGWVYHCFFKAGEGGMGGHMS